MKRRPTPFGISFTSQAIVYPFFLVGAFIFAQLLKRPISFMLLLTVILLPLVSFIQLAAARAFIKVRFRTSQGTVTKLTPLRLSAVVVNSSPIPMPFLEAVITVPCENEVRCMPHSITFSLLPFGSAHIEKSGMFSFIGEYSVGVNTLYVYDFFRAVRLSLPVNKACDITVLPRIFELSQKERTAPSYDRENKGRTGDFDIIGIREYRYGDNQRHIHWKLTSKGDETMVKEYAGGEGAPGYVLLDLHPLLFRSASETLPEDADTVNRVCLDLVIEAALSAAKRELELSGSAVIAWMESGEAAFVQIASQADFDAALLRMCSVKPDHSDEQFSILSERLAIPRNVSVVGVSGVLNTAVVSDFLTLTGRIAADTVGCEFIYSHDFSLLADGCSEGVINGCIDSLAVNGAWVIDVSAAAPKLWETKK